MQPNNNSPAPSPLQPPPVRPIHDISAQSTDPGLANLTKTGAVFSDLNPTDVPSNPIAGTAAPQSGVIHDQSTAEQSLDGVLKQVTSNIKATAPVVAQPAKKKGFFGGGKAKKQHPAAASHGPTKSAVTNPIHQAQSKPKKPILAIVFAVLAAFGLGVAAVMSF